MNRSKSLGIALASVLVVAAALGLAGFALASAAPHQTPLVCAAVQGQSHTCSLTMATYPDSGEGVHGKDGGPHPDWVTYSNDNVVLPANSTIDMTIDQYDSGGSLNNAFFDQIMGTIGGTATIDGKTVSPRRPQQRRTHLHPARHSRAAVRTCSSRCRCRPTATPTTQSC